MGESPVSERVARAQERFYGPVPELARRSPLHTGVLGHSVHPPLTDVTLGCWLSASLLDLAGGPQARPAATLLVGVGAGGLRTDGHRGRRRLGGPGGGERRIGAVHALGTDVASLLLLGSLVARLRGRHAAGRGLGLAGNVVAAGAGFLGGHLALTRGTARRAVPTV